MATLTFHGAAGTVTGSRHLLARGGRQWMIDCGLFQGRKELRLKNWEPAPVGPQDLDGVLLTHAHIDHTGFLPRLVRGGYAGPVHATHATADLCRILLPDTAHLQEEEARWANKQGSSRHHPALPLFTGADAERALGLLRGVHYGEEVVLDDGVRAKWRDAGHILGSAHVDVKARRGGRVRKIVFGGDLGRPADAVLDAPAQAYGADYLVLESTYGDRRHAEADPAAELARVVAEAMDLGGPLVIPSFAVGRSQTLLYLLGELEEEGRIPPLPVYLDSPMALEALEVSERRLPDLNLLARRRVIQGRRIFRPRHLHLTASRDESKAINRVKGRAIIISASGMCTGGRILHHLAQRLPDERATVLFVGYQAEGTRGRDLLDGAKQLRMFGQMVPVRARTARIEGFSGHADYEEILAWLLGFPRPPERTFLVHGEPAAAAALRDRIVERFGWEVTIPREGESFEIDLAD